MNDLATNRLKALVNGILNSRSLNIAAVTAPRFASHRSAANLASEFRNIAESTQPQAAGTTELPEETSLTLPFYDGNNQYVIEMRELLLRLKYLQSNPGESADRCLEYGHHHDAIASTRKILFEISAIMEKRSLQMATKPSVTSPEDSD